MNKFYTPIICFVLCLALLSFSPAKAQTIIRDTEIETSLRTWATPIFTAAGLVPENVNIILIQDSGINAFVAGGSNIFIYTGLLDKAENPGEVIGVIAHETGHISGGHLIRLRSSIEQASYETIIGTILGIGAAVLTGEGAAATAIIGGSQNVATSRFLSNSRLNESSADQAGLRFMNNAGLDPKGLLTFMETMEGQELLPQTQQQEYVRTHPLTGNRMEALRTKIQESPHAGKAYPKEWVDDFARMKAKLLGFINPDQVQWKYSDNDNSIPALYARAIASYRKNQVEDALVLTNQLLSKEPNNPYFHELKGQMLVDFSRVDEALPPYEKAVALSPQSDLIRIAYAHALIESANRNNQPKKLEQAISQLDIARRKEKKSTRIYRLLATAYGRLGDETSARLNLAEEAVLQRRIPDAKRFAAYVVQNSDLGTSQHIRAKDILKYVEEIEKDS